MNVMDDNLKNSEFEPTNPETAQKDYLLPASPRTTTREDLITKSRSDSRSFGVGASILISTLILAGAWVYTAGLKVSNDATQSRTRKDGNPAANLAEKVFPQEGTALPVRWGDLGIKMVSVGVINPQKITALYASCGGLGEYERRLLESADNGNLKITRENSGFLLNLFWALGLGTKNDILETGPMVRYSGASSPADLSAESLPKAEAFAKAGNFASTGGWTMADGGAMNHYSRHPFVVLTPAQQQLVERISKNIYRPCCDNPTHFPDCNHGMAMLGLLELMASQGVSEEEMYKTALRVNAYWFPDTYLTIAQYLVSKGIDWDKADPKEILGAKYSSASGYAQVASRIAEPQPPGSGSGCGLDAPEAAPSQRQQGDCGI